MLEGSTDSDVAMFSSEEDEDGNEPDSCEDGQLDDNSETNEDGGTRTSGLKIPHLKWTNLSGPKHSLPVGSSDKDFFSVISDQRFLQQSCGRNK